MSDDPPAPRVLLVEDDRDTRDMYSHYLRYSGLDVTAAESARVALERVERARPDVVVTDIAMPGMDGIELARRLRARSQTQDVPIIAVSGQVSPGAHEAGATVVLEKPCAPETLLHVIESVLKQDYVAPPPPDRDEPPRHE